MNRTRMTDNGEISLPFVQLLAFSKNGYQMASIDGQHNPNIKSNSHLKFWSYDSESQEYTLNTRINSPHCLKIVCLHLFQLKELSLAYTICEDGSFKIWEYSQNEDPKDGKFLQSCDIFL